MGPWQTARALSLDIVVGGVCGGWLAVHVTAASMPPVWWLLLPAAIWITYTWDHLMDARRVGPSACQLRHKVHAGHFRLLLRMSFCLAAAAGLAALVWLPAVLLVPGLILAGLVTVYLIGSQVQPSGRRWKEPAAGLLYTAGIWYGPLLQTRATGYAVLLCVLLFALAAVLNLLVCSLFEMVVDREEGHASVVLVWGPRRTAWLVRILAMTGVGLAATAAITGPAGTRSAFGILGILLAAPLLVLAVPVWFSASERYRLFGDLVFLLPALPPILDRLP